MKIVQVGQVDSARSLAFTPSLGSVAQARALRSCVFYDRAFKSRLVASLATRLLI